MGQREGSYEENIRLLEELINCLEKGDISLEEGLASFEKGIALIQVCQKQLERIAQKIQVLTQTGEAHDFSGEAGEV